MCVVLSSVRAMACASHSLHSFLFKKNFWQAGKPHCLLQLVFKMFLKLVQYINLLTGNQRLVTSPNIAGSKLTYLGACSSPIELKITSKHLGSKPLSLGVPVIVCVFPEPVMPYANTKPVSKKYRRANYIQYYSCSKVSSSY